MPIPYSHFPRLQTSVHQITSAKDTDYNCIAWAAKDTERWWWPFGGEEAYWPPNVPKTLSVDSLIAAFATIGYKVVSNGNLESMKEKVVLYTDQQNTPTHMARQLNNGQWTSKLGQNHDISHATPDAVEGPAYGIAVIFLERYASNS